MKLRSIAAVVLGTCVLAMGATSAGAATPRYVTAGNAFTCGLKASGSIACWGNNYDGQSSPPATGTYTQIDGDAGSDHSCALTSAGGVKCWGSDGFGKVSQAPTSGTYSQVAAGGTTGCGLKTDQSLICWGSTTNGKTNVPAGTYTQVSAGYAGVCAIKTDKTVACWGYGGSRALGGPLYPTHEFSQIDVGDYDACGVRVDGTIHCWGYDTYGSLPPDPPAGETWKQVSVGVNQACALASNGGVVCWVFPGFNGIPGFGLPAGTYTRVSVGQFHVCGVKTDDTVTCSGRYEFYGELGRAPTIANSPDAAVQSSPYTFSFSGAAIPAATFTQTGGTLPPGLTLSPGGTLSGTPTTQGSYTFTVKAANEFYAPDATKTVTMAVKKASTTVATTSPTTSVKGQDVTLTATVSGAGGPPTGDVTFKDGSTTLGTGTLNAFGVAELHTTGLGVGSHTITAQYAGDANFGPSTNSSTQVVSKASTTTGVESSANPSAHGQSVTFTATVAAVAPGTGTPAGTVTFEDGGTQIGSGTVDGAGKATFTTAALGVGDHTIVARYGGNTNYATSDGALASGQTVDKATSSTSVSASDNPSVRGQSVTFTATVAAVAPGTGTPDGTVTFMDGSTNLGTGTLSGGQATLTTDDLGVGSHTITANYGGATNFGASDGSLGQQVNQAATTTAVATSDDPSVHGQSVTFTATVAPVAPGAGAPTGDVTFKDGSTVIGTGTLGSGGTATFATDDLSVADHAITADYAGDNDFKSSAGALADAQTVEKAGTATTVGSSDNPSVRGQSVTFTATVAAVAPGAGTPTGDVTFKDGTTTLGTASVDGSGQATLATSALGVGDHTITAEYGSGNDFDSSSGALAGGQQVVNKAATTAAVASSDTTSKWGRLVTFTATVAAVAPGAGTPGGTVTFKDGATTLGTATLDAAGRATLATSALAVGSHAITAGYAGDTDFAASSTTSLAQDVAKAATAASVAASSTSSTAGEGVTFTAAVTRADGGSGKPGGEVTFRDGSATIGTATLDAAGQATLSKSDLGVGDHSITVVYAGDERYVASESAAVGHAVSAAPVPQTPADVPVVATRLAISHRSTPRSGSYVKLVVHCRGAAGTRCKGTMSLDPASGSTRLAAAGRYGRAKFDVAAGANRSLRIKATSKLLRALRAKRRVIVMATAAFTGQNAAKLTIERRLTVVEPRARR
jgi:hypothetical protein